MKNQKRRVKHAKLLFCSVLVAFFALVSTAYAITRGYVTEDAGLKPGMAVRLSDDSAAENPKVERAADSDAGKFVGIAAEPANSELLVASSDQSVFVTSEGEVGAFVSNINGDVKRGDQLSLSPLKGILAKAGPKPKLVLGFALEDFSFDGSEVREIQTSEGTKTVNIDSLKLSLDPKSVLAAGQEPSSLEQLGSSIVGEPVSGIRVALALVVFLIVVLAEGTIIYGAVSSAITSLGRNPLAKSAIRRGLSQTMVVSVAVLFVGLGAIYIILWL